jgi:hypothetical protein
MTASKVTRAEKASWAEGQIKMIAIIVAPSSSNQDVSARA